MKKRSGAPVQVDVPVEYVDCDVAQGENHSGKENDLVIKDISVFGPLTDNPSISLQYQLLQVQGEIPWVENVRSAEFVNPASNPVLPVDSKN